MLIKIEFGFEQNKLLEMKGNLFFSFYIIN